jgi:hypothetical protein
MKYVRSFITSVALSMSTTGLQEDEVSLTAASILTQTSHSRWTLSICVPLLVVKFRADTKQLTVLWFRMF